MHKEVIICVITILIIILSNFVTQNYAKESVEIMDEKLDELEKEIENEKDNKIEEKMKKVMEAWKERYEKLAFFIEHDELEKVETELTSLKAHISTKQYEEAIEPLERSIFILNHIKEKFKLNMKNIF